MLRTAPAARAGNVALPRDERRAVRTPGEKCGLSCSHEDLRRAAYMNPSYFPRMRCRASIRCRPLLSRWAPPSVRVPPRLVGASFPCKFRGLARKRPSPAAPAGPPAGGPQRHSERGECACSKEPCGPLACCECPWHHGPERAERRPRPADLSHDPGGARLWRRGRRRRGDEFGFERRNIRG